MQVDASAAGDRVGEGYAFGFRMKPFSGSKATQAYKVFNCSP